jgi:uncharacterized protein (UPF0261 family)
MSHISRLIAVTNCPRTAQCAEAVTTRLQDRGWPVRTFPADGVGGRELEAAIRADEITAVIELSLTELAADLLRTDFGAGPERLTAAGLTGVPQLIVAGGLDAAQARPGSDRRPIVEFEGKFYIRTSPADCDRLGQEIAFKISAARGAAILIVPRGGLSALDRPGGPLWQPEADAALIQSLRNWLPPGVPVVEIPENVCDWACAERIVATLFTATDALGPS